MTLLKKLRPTGDITSSEGWRLRELEVTAKSSPGCNCIIKIPVPVYSQYCFPLARDGAISNYRIFLDIPNKILVSRPDKEEAVAVNLWNISSHVSPTSKTDNKISAGGTNITRQDHSHTFRSSPILSPLSETHQVYQVSSQTRKSVYKLQIDSIHN